VFELLSEPGEMKRWVGGLREFNSLDPGPAFGARAIQVVQLGGRTWEVESEITRYEPPYTLESTLRHRAFTSFLLYSLEEEDGRTRLRGEIETDVRMGANRLLGGLIRRQTQRKLEDDLARLKRLAEDGDEH
jgi:Polyketide cyclase / dehydrase and lipid transport